MTKTTYIIGCVALLSGIGFGVLNSIGNSKVIDKIGHTEYREKAMNAPVMRQIDTNDIRRTEKSTPDRLSEESYNFEACFSDCQQKLVESVLSGDSLSPEKVTYIYANLDDFVHFLRFHPEIIEKAAIYITSSDIGEEGSSNYNEDLDRDIMLLDEIISRLPIRDLNRTTHLLLSSNENMSRQAGLAYVEKMFLNVEDELEVSPVGETTETGDEALDNKAEISTLLNHFLYTETDQKLQIKAIQMLADYNPDVISEQTVGLLSNMSTNALDTEIRGQAIELAAVAAKPESLVLTQMEDELRHPSSASLQLSSLRALDISLKRSYNKDPAMMERLGEFEVYLEQLARNAGPQTEISNYAEGLLQAYYIDK